jgi:sulfate-transporting ATPase
MPSHTQVIYSFSRARKLYPTNKQVLHDILIGFSYGAKIVVLGLNGNGKSTLVCEAAYGQT